MRRRSVQLLLCIVTVGMFTFGAIPAIQAQDYRGNWQRQKNPQAVAEVLAGTREVANAAWWGFDEKDSTRFLQAAINSKSYPDIIFPRLYMNI